MNHLQQVETLPSAPGFRLNKSLITTIVSVLLIPIGYYSPLFKDQIMSMGLFATSGAITNWIAIYMLFEKVPFLYGSGVIPSRFKEFKAGIKELIMNQFFTEENIQKFLSAQGSSGLDLSKISGVIDYDVLFNKMVEVVEESSLGGMLNMFGGAAVLEGMRQPFQEKASATIQEMVTSEEFQSKLSSVFSSSSDSSISHQVEQIVDGRLSELTPKLVKEIIQRMIREHLGWLVVWGGVFGALLGILAEFIR